MNLLGCFSYLLWQPLCSIVHTGKPMLLELLDLESKYMSLTCST